MPELKQWSRRYLRTSRTRGEELYVLERTAVRGVWTCVNPRLTVSSVNLTGNAVSTSARPGITYAPMPILTQDQKNGAVTASQALIAGGVSSAALGSYQPRGSGLQFLLALVPLQLITGVLGRPFASPRRFALSAGLVGILYFAALATGVMDALGMFCAGVYGWALITWETYIETYETTMSAVGTMREFVALYQIGVREFGILVFSCAALM